MYVVMQANEDCNCYSYDARKLTEAKCVHQDHVSAVYVFIKNHFLNYPTTVYYG